jgi:nucleoside-diphosphate-sugar epimerase/CBS domain-containing protein
MPEIEITIGNEFISSKMISIDPESTISDAMSLIDTKETGMVVITDENDEIIGLATDGDIRRAIINGAKSSTPVEQVMNKNPLYIGLDESIISPEEELIRLIRSKILEKAFIEKLTRRIRKNVFIPVIKESSKKLVGAISVYVAERELSPGFKQQVSQTDKLTSGVKKVLVIGGSGYVGTKLVNQLVSQGMEVRVLDKFLWGNDTKDLWDDNPKVEVIEGDVLHIETVIDVMKGVDAVCHLAALVGDPACGLDFPTTLATNYLSTLQVAEVCKYFQINRLIFASTCSVYGASIGKTELVEGMPLNPVSSYARTKIDAERALLQMTDKNFSPTSLRIATIYGLSERMRFDLVVNLLTAMAYYKGEITIFGGKQWRPFIHVEDAARGYLNALSAPISQVRGQIFNLGNSQENYQIEYLATIIKEFLPETKVIIKDDLDDPRNYYVNFDKIQSRLNYKTQWTVRAGIKEMIEKMQQGFFADWQNAKYSNYKKFKEIIKTNEIIPPDL